jgi:hypothetical protein
MKKATKFSFLALFLASCILFGLVMLDSYVFVRSDIALLSDETCQRIVVKEVLGTSKHPDTCSRSSYASVTENISEARSACMFELQPLPREEKNATPLR